MCVCVCVTHFLILMRNLASVCVLLHFHYSAVFQYGGVPGKQVELHAHLSVRADTGMRHTLGRAHTRTIS